MIGYNSKTFHGQRLCFSWNKKVYKLFCFSFVSVSFQFLQLCGKYYKLIGWQRHRHSSQRIKIWWRRFFDMGCKLCTIHDWTFTEVARWCRRWKCECPSSQWTHDEQDSTRCVSGFVLLLSFLFIFSSFHTRPQYGIECVVQCCRCRMQSMHDSRLVSLLLLTTIYIYISNIVDKKTILLTPPTSSPLGWNQLKRRAT